MKKNIIILDINSHIHRAYFIAKKSSNLDHEKEGAYYNGKPNYIIQRAVKIIEDEIIKIEKAHKFKPDYIACVLDHTGKNFRHELYPEYKGTRPPTDPEFNFMRNCIFKILSLKGYYTIRKEGVEADDIIGTIALKSENAGLNVIIGTDDKDFFQRVSENVKVFRGKINKLYSINDVIEAQGVHPNQVLDYLAMDGDKADNVIGIPGCGHKTCLLILQKYTLDQVIDEPDLLNNINGIRGREKMITYIKENKDFILLMKEIVKLKDDMELGLFLKDLVKKEPDVPSLLNAYSKLGIRRNNI